MIDTLVEEAFACGAVREVVPECGGYDRYLLDPLADHHDEVVELWVRPDGKFSRASGSAGQLSIGQVAQLCGLTGRARNFAG